MSKRLIAESFIEKAKKKHSEYNYDYSEVVYVNSKTKYDRMYETQWTS